MATNKENIQKVQELTKKFWEEQVKASIEKYWEDAFLWGLENTSMEKIQWATPTKTQETTQNNIVDTNKQNENTQQETVTQTQEDTVTSVPTDENTQKFFQQPTKEDLSAQTLEKFKSAFLAWDTATAWVIYSKNKKLKDQFTTFIKEQQKIQTFNNKVTKFENASFEDIKAAMKAWELIKWSEVYNALSPDQKLVVERAYDFSTDLMASPENIQATAEKLYDAMYWDYAKESKDRKDQFQKDTKDLKANMTSLKQQINEYDQNIRNIWDDTQEQYPNLPKSTIAAIVARKTKDLSRARDDLARLYNNDLLEYQNYVDEYELDLSVMKETAAYKSKSVEQAIEMYKGKIDADSKEKLANLEREHEMDMLDKKIKADDALAKWKDSNSDANGKFEWKFNEVEWVWYYDDGKWNMQRLPSVPDGWEYYLREDGTVGVRVRNLNGDIIWQTWLPENIEDIIKAQPWSVLPSKYGTKYNDNGGMQCWEYVNQALWTNMSDSIASKLKVASERTGGWVWDAVVYIPEWTNIEYQKYWHTGLIVDEDWDKWLVRSSNLKWDGKMSDVWVNKNEILWYTPNKYNIYTQLEKSYNSAQIKFMEELDINNVWKDERLQMYDLGLSDAEIFQWRTDNMDAQTRSELTLALDNLNALKWWYNTFDELYENEWAKNSMFGWPSWFEWVWFRYMLPRIEWTKEYVYQELVEAFVWSATLSNMDMIKWVLSDSDLALLKRASAWWLNVDLTQPAFIDIAKKLENAYMKWLGRVEFNGTTYGVSDLTKILNEWVDAGKLKQSTVDAFWRSKWYNTF